MSPSSDAIRVRPLDAPGLPAAIEVPERGLRVGRDPANDIALDAEAFPHTSAFHCRIGRASGRWVVEDLGSKNGTLVNGARVERCELLPGDVIQLGPGVGARFVVLPAELENAATVEIDPSAGRHPRGDTLTPSRVMRLQDALGLPRDPEAVRRLSSSSGRRASSTLALLLVAGAAVIAAVGIGLLADRQQRDLAELRDVGRALGRSIEEGLARQQERWERERSRLEVERAQLASKVTELEASGAASAADLDRVREALAQATERVGRFRPLDLEELERARAEKLRRALAAVVFIDKRLLYRERGSDRYLHVPRDGEARLRPVTDAADLYVEDAETGSGFVVSERGWIVTNAHVVDSSALGEPVSFGDSVLELELRIDVVFSGTAVKRPARVLKALDGGPDDLAVLAIEPFEGMPSIEGFSLSAPTIEAGDEVRLFGFPLGRNLLQEGRTFTASVFAGIVSRRVRQYLQVQAAVYPGNSGGPVLDADGRVIGVVTAVQKVPGGQIASDIGFVLPIDRLAPIWPPEPDAAGSSRPSG